MLCGGRSSRFGSDKALADVGGRPLAALIVDSLRAIGADPVAAIGGSAGDALGIPTVPDRFPDEGPLGGLTTALLWAKRGTVLVTPCDLPLLRSSDLAMLIDAHERRETAEAAVVATLDGRPQPSLALWPAARATELLRLLNDGQRAWRAALDAGPWIGVELSPDALADADTPEALATLVQRR
ncbi:MAG: molybdenum cofactor guanylyltransferase [Acidimicrobiales bacterium]